MNTNSVTVLVMLIAAVLLHGCNRPVEVTTRPCDQLGRTTDPKLEAELKDKCGHGGPAFKPTPKTRTY